MDTLLSYHCKVVSHLDDFCVFYFHKNKTKSMNVLHNITFNVFYFAVSGESKERFATRHLLSSLEVS